MRDGGNGGVSVVASYLTQCRQKRYRCWVIKSYRSKALERLWSQDDAAQLDQRMVARLLRRLDALNLATEPMQMNVPGFNFHTLRGRPQRYSVHVNGPWCLTFGWHDQDAIGVDLENYH